MKLLARIGALSFIALALLAFAQAQASARAPRTIVVKMIDKSPTEYVFEPATIEAKPGDVIKFVQTSSMPHNVDFKGMPTGVDLGERRVGPLLTAPNQTYEITLDAKFAKGTYQFVCDPHEALGMKGTLTVGDGKKLAEK